MSQTLIKRLYQGTDEFVPITLAEAVVVNTNGFDFIDHLEITTLDKVLAEMLNIDVQAQGSISTLTNTVNTINTTLQSKLTADQLRAGTGITISSDGSGNLVISSTGVSSLNLYTIVTQLPTASKSCLNSIYLVPSSEVSGNLFTEFLCYEQNGTYLWEQIGTIQSSIDLSGYVTTVDFNAAIGGINTTLSELSTTVNDLEESMITASNVLFSGTSQSVYVSYTIPSDLYTLPTS